MCVTALDKSEIGLQKLGSTVGPLLLKNFDDSIIVHKYVSTYRFSHIDGEL